MRRQQRRKVETYGSEENMTTPAEQKAAARQFAEFWRSKGYEKGQTQPFWLSLLRVLGVERPETLHEDDRKRVRRRTLQTLSGARRGKAVKSAHTRTQFRAQVCGMQIGFKGTEALNTVLEVGEEGDWGFLRDLRMDERFLNNPGDNWREYLR